MNEGLHPELEGLTEIQGHQENKLGMLLSLSLAQLRAGCRSTSKLATAKAVAMAF
jgi:hypothetical protein